MDLEYKILDGSIDEKMKSSYILSSVLFVPESVSNPLEIVSKDETKQEAELFCICNQNLLLYTFPSLSGTMRVLIVPNRSFS